VDEMNDQLRAVLFVILALAILFTWSHFYKFPESPQKPAISQPTTPPFSPTFPAASANGRGVSAGTTAGAAKASPVVNASREKILSVDARLYRVELSNRGGVVRSWKLNRYFDDQKPPKPLDLVNASSAEELGWPFSLLLPDKTLETEANSALYEVKASDDELQAPREVTFDWSDGHLEVRKKISFTESYELSLEVSATLDGRPLPVGVEWLGGFGDKEVYQASQQVGVFYKQNGKLNVLSYKKLGVSGNPMQPFLETGPMEYAGIEDSFFTATFIPNGTDLSLWHWTQWHHYQDGDKTVAEPEAELAVGTASDGALDMRAYVGPKDYTILSKMSPPLEALVNFGWTGVIAKPLFYALKWIYKYVPNYGWAIVLLTLAINLPLFPLKVMSWRSMQRMQKVAPEIRSIQDRYKKYSMNDPRKRKMNEEVMAIYQREGINPMTSCLPMLAQAPIWWALWRVLTGAIELRQAHWIWWIHDLSVKDPYYILPGAMAVTMYLMTKMTPTPTTDPAQAKMQKLMPLMFVAFFFRLSSGLNLYMFTSNLVGVAQQLYLNKTDPLPSRSKFKSKNKSKDAGT
jgi:YidC/Oxa1 family membrane protein insertase